MTFGTGAATVRAHNEKMFSVAAHGGRGDNRIIFGTGAATVRTHRTVTGAGGGDFLRDCKMSGDSRTLAVE